MRLQIHFTDRPNFTSTPVSTYFHSVCHFTNIIKLYPIEKLGIIILVFLTCALQTKKLKCFVESDRLHQTKNVSYASCSTAVRPCWMIMDLYTCSRTLVYVEKLCQYHWLVALSSCLQTSHNKASTKWRPCQWFCVFKASRILKS